MNAHPFVKSRENANLTKLGIIVCADDFGASNGINEAIVQLLQMQRLSAVSCMVAGSAWTSGAKVLKSYHGKIDLGLHLFYEEMPFDKVLKLLFLRRINRDLIWRKFKFQLETFIQTMGFLPDFIDGHQYIHQLPVFHSVVIDLIQSFSLKKVYVRNTAALISAEHGSDFLIKKMLVAVPGCFFKRCLVRNKIATNNDFLGIYNFQTSRHSSKVLDGFLRLVKKPNTIFVTHPGLEQKVGGGYERPIERKRLEEFNYLRGERFVDTLTQKGLCLSRFTYD